MRLSVKIKILIHLAFIIILCSCGSDEKVKNIRKREKQINEKEQQLMLFEQQLKLKEEGLIKREKFIDSLRKQTDTISLYNPDIIGNWQVRMSCIETTCESSAIGDTKTERWNISYKNNIVIAKAITNEKVTRIYTGLFNGTGIQLTAQQSAAETVIKVFLTYPINNKMEGEREIIQGGNCKIIYSLEAEKL